VAVHSSTVSDFDRSNCSVKLALDLLGERWTMLVLREAFYGVRRFDELLENVGCARNLLADRLTKLVDEGVLVKVAYRNEGARMRYEYRLTEKGRDFFPILLSLLAWGDKWRAAKGGPPVRVRHRGCGEPVRVELVCDAGHHGLGPRDTEPVPTAAAKRKRPPSARPRSPSEAGLVRTTERRSSSVVSGKS
jgi:DNA-binding HxlR family transcriptional regulator